MRVVLLAGGLGTRLAEETSVRPKPMVEIGGRPMLWHIMKLFAQHGLRDFCVALGYKGDYIKRYFLDYHHAQAQGALSIDLATGRVETEQHREEAWNVNLIDTGHDTNTGGRVLRMRRWLEGGTFMVTYGDGVSDIDVGKLLAFHRQQGRVATVTAVRPPARYGGLMFDGDLVGQFTEKPQAGEGWINGGYLVFEPAVFDYLQDDKTSLESDALERLAADGQLAAYRHEGFWQCMDTLRDKNLLERLWEEKQAPWAVWREQAVGCRLEAGGEKDGEQAAPPQAPRASSLVPRTSDPQPAAYSLKPDFWLDRPTLVTGATGLVGSWLVRRLVAMGAEVVCLVRDWVPQATVLNEPWIDRVRIARGDICDQSLVERVLGEYEIDTVMHLAAQAIVGVANRNPVSTFESNIAGTWSVLEACRRSPRVKQIVTASSDKAYGDCSTLPYIEATPLAGQHPYDVSKSCADLIARSYAVTYGLPVAITRCGNFYGGGDLNWNRIVPGTIRGVLRGQAPVIRSDGQFVRDYFYVEDGAAAYMLLAEKLAENPQLRGEAFNFSNETQISVLELVARIQREMNSNYVPRILGEASNEIRNQHLSAEKARTVLHWQPLYSLEDGLRETIAWYKTFLEGASCNMTLRKAG
jgi:CDP-glucose 4,6-dehydratase